MDKRRKWIAVLLEEALQLNVIAPSDVLGHTNTSILATDLPPPLVAEVLQAGLDNTAFDADLVVRTLGPERMAEHLPLPVLWTCIDEAAQELVGAQGETGDRARAGAAPAEPVAPGDVAPEQVAADDMPEIEVLEE